MTLAEIQAFVAGIDSAAGHYDSASSNKGAYTVWREYRMLPRTHDDVHGEGWAFQIDRYSQAENDAIAAAFKTALDGDDRIAYEYQIDYEPDTRTVHHIFDCEGY